MTLTLPPMKDVEVTPGVVLLEEPTPVPGTNKLRGLADVNGQLCIVEFGMRFA